MWDCGFFFRSRMRDALARASNDTLLHAIIVMAKVIVDVMMMVVRWAPQACSTM